MGSPARHVVMQRGVHRLAPAQPQQPLAGMRPTDRTGSRIVPQLTVPILLVSLRQHHMHM